MVVFLYVSALFMCDTCEWNVKFVLWACAYFVFVVRFMCVCNVIVRCVFVCLVSLCIVCGVCAACECVLFI